MQKSLKGCLGEGGWKSGLYFSMKTTSHKAMDSPSAKVRNRDTSICCHSLILPLACLRDKVDLVREEKNTN